MRLAGKLAFVHRTLWQRDQTYRWAVLLGPPPLLGIALAALVLTAWQAMRPGASMQRGIAPWAHVTRSAVQDAQPFAEPTQPLPPVDASGLYQGFQRGWQSEVHLLSIDAAKEVTVSEAGLASFTLDQPDIPLQRVVDAGPPNGLFIVRAQSFFTVQTPGIYAFSARLVRSGTQTADCIVRLNSSSHMMLRNIALNVAGSATLSYQPTQFRLKPGLFKLGVAVGCWRGAQALGTGDFMLIVRAPRDSAIRPATAEEVVRPAS